MLNKSTHSNFKEGTLHVILKVPTKFSSILDDNIAYLTRYDSVNRWISPEVFLVIPNFLHNFKVLYQSTFVPKVGCPNPYWSGASAI